MTAPVRSDVTLPTEPEFFIEPEGESSTHCACCGNVSRIVWGAVDTSERRVAAYFVQWTVGSPDHHPNLDLVVGAWGEGTTPDDRVLVSVLSLPGGISVIDATGRRADDRALYGRALTRDEVIGTPFATNVFALFDAIWVQDVRIQELHAWSAAPEARS
jgi:hypothetical protein